MADQIGRAGGDAVSMALDVRDETSVEEVVSGYAQRSGRLDVVVASAGVSSRGWGASGSVIDLGSDVFRAVVDVNLFGCFYTLRAAARWLVSNERPGSLIALGSVASRLPLPGNLPYCVSKAGVWMMTKVMASELAAHNVRVNAIGPGWIDTAMTQFLHADKDAMDWALAMTPMGRLGSPTEVAAAALFLASDDSSYFTGELLHPAGGMYTD